MKLAGMICKLGRQVSGEFADCAVQIGGLDGTYTPWWNAVCISLLDFDVEITSRRLPSTTYAV